MDDEMRRNISHALGLLLEAAKQTALKNVQKSMPRPKLLPGRGQEQNKKP